MKNINVRKLCATALLGALGTVLMFIEISVPIMPAFIKFDFSELPSLMAAFAFGPIAGASVCFIKNLLHLFITSTMGIGELSNFLLGVAFVVPAGLIYQRNKTRKMAAIASFSGALMMSVLCLPINLFITYPLYAKFLLPEQVILSAYQALLPSVSNLAEALLVFNVPFTFFKVIIVASVCFIIYKKISPILKG